MPPAPANASVTAPQREQLKGQLQDILNQFLENKEKKEITPKDLETLLREKQLRQQLSQKAQSGVPPSIGSLSTSVGAALLPQKPASPEISKEISNAMSQLLENLN